MGGYKSDPLWQARRDRKEAELSSVPKSLHMGTLPVPKLQPWEDLSSFSSLSSFFSFFTFFFVGERGVGGVVPAFLLIPYRGARLQMGLWLAGCCLEGSRPLLQTQASLKVLSPVCGKRQWLGWTVAEEA